jgi:8-oxo-dGTP pyrophosphatase MutT (NUDIX family)
MAMSVGDSRLIISPSQTATAQPSSKFFRVSQVRRLRKCQQVAAVCYRIRGSNIEFLLVQTRGGRWTFPKGGVEPGLTHAQAAALEAYEEAGVHGRMEEVSFTRYVRRKGSGNSSAIEVGVSAHLCEVLRLGPPQEFNRNRTWFSAEKAKRRLREQRSPDYGAELARVVDRAVAHIQRLRWGTGTAVHVMPKVQCIDGTWRMTKQDRARDRHWKISQ